MDPVPAAHLNRYATVVFALLLLALPAWAAWTWLPQRYPHACAVLGGVPGMDAVLAERHCSDAAALLAAHRSAVGGGWQERERRCADINGVIEAGLVICERHPMTEPEWRRRELALRRMRVQTNSGLRQIDR